MSTGGRSIVRPSRNKKTRAGHTGHVRARRADTVMLVEDNPHIRSDLAEILRGEGYKVVTASEGGEALDRMRSAMRPGVILLDLVMQGMDGWEFRDRQLRDPALADVPVILMSGLTEIPRHAAQLAVAAHVTKPIELNSLLATVERHCSPQAD